MNLIYKFFNIYIYMSYSGFSSNYKNPVVAAAGALGQSSKYFGDQVSAFRNNKLVAGATEFLWSNSIIAKVSFLILVVLIFVMSLRIGSRVLSWVQSPSTNPVLLKGLKNGKRFVKITQDPKLDGSKPIIRSKNEAEGIEFTWSVWLFIDDMVYRQGQKKHIFHKGSAEMDRKTWNEKDITGIAFPNNGPGLYLHETENKLVVVMNTFDKILEEVEIPNIPLSKWINVVLRQEGRNLDVFINGTIAVRHVLSSPPKQNYGDVYINMNNGFSGLISALKYFAYSLSAAEIRDLNSAGPNMTADESLSIFPPYFSMRWFFKDGTEGEQ